MIHLFDACLELKAKFRTKPINVKIVCLLGLPCGWLEVSLKAAGAVVG